MLSMIGKCGINCTTCDGYLATQAGDQQQLEKVAALWRKEYNNPAITVEYVTCDGCININGRLGGHCAECRIRNCPSAAAIPNCAHCPNYQSCEIILDFFSFVPAAKINLDLIHQEIHP